MQIFDIRRHGVDEVVTPAGVYSRLGGRFGAAFTLGPESGFERGDDFGHGNTRGDDIGLGEIEQLVFRHEASVGLGHRKTSQGVRRNPLYRQIHSTVKEITGIFS
jgi:hypothetical protein